MGGGEPEAPSAAETGAQNRETAKYNTEMSFVDQYGPWGSYIYTKLPQNMITKSERYQNGTDAYGNPIWDTRTWEEADPNQAPRYRLDVNLSPAELQKMQGLDNIQLALLGLGQNQLGSVQHATNTPYYGRSWDEVTRAKVDTLNKQQYQGRSNWTAKDFQDAVNKDFGSYSDPNAEWWKMYGQKELAGYWIPDAPTVPKTTISDKDMEYYRQSTSPTISKTDFSDILGGEEGRQKAAENAYKYLTYGYDDRYARQQADLESQLASQGIRPGSAAYQQAMGDFGTGKNEAYERAELQAYNTGLQELESMFNQRMGVSNLNLQAQNALFNQQNQGMGQYLQAQNALFNQQQSNASLGSQLRSQALQEEAYNRSRPLNELSALISGTQVQAPQFTPVQTSQVPYQPYFQPSSGEGWTSALMGMGGSLGQAGIMGAFMSTKERKDPIGPAESVLEKVKTLKIDRWRYKLDDAVHIGPYAEDWHASFGGKTDKEISIIDALGVSLKAIQELSAEVDTLKAKLAEVGHV